MRQLRREVDVGRDLNVVRRSAQREREGGEGRRAEKPTCGRRRNSRHERVSPAAGGSFSRHPEVRLGSGVDVGCDLHRKLEALREAIDLHNNVGAQG